LAYWLVAIPSRWVGEVNEWIARVPSVLAAVGTVLTLAWLVKQRRGWREGWLAGMTVATMMGFLMLARRAMADMPMTFFVTACCAAMWTACDRRGRGRFGWLVVAGVAGGLAVLAKGPAPLLVLPGPVLVALVVMARDPRRRGREARPIAESTSHDRALDVPADRTWTMAGVTAGVLIFLALGLAWPIGVLVHIPTAASVWGSESIGRAMGQIGREEPAYFYLLRLPILVLPWTYFFLHGVWRAIRRAVSGAGDRDWLLFIGAWLLLPLIGFSMAVGKQDHYILPALPAAAIYVAMAMSELFSPAAARAGKRVAAAHGTAFLGAGVAAVLYVLWAHPAYQVGGVLLGSLLVAAGALALVLAVRGRLYGGQVVLAAALLIALPLAWTTMIGPIDKATEAKRFGQDVAGLVPPETPVFFLTEENATVIFYANRTIPLWTRARALATKSLADGDLFLISRTASPPPPMTPPRRWRILAFEGDPSGPEKGLWLFCGTVVRESAPSPRPVPAGRGGAPRANLEPVHEGARRHD